MKRIDLIGAPGVGKSTFVNYLTANKSKLGKYLTVSDALYLALLNAELSYFKKAFLFINRKMGMNSKGLQEWIFSNLIDPGFQTFMKSDPNTVILNLKKILNEGNAGSHEDTLKRCYHYPLKIKKAFFIHANLRDEYFIVSDESITQKTDTSVLTSFVNINGVKSPFLPDVVIHCTDKAEAIAKKLEQRRNQGLLTGWHNHFLGKDLNYEINKLVEYNYEKSHKLKDAGIPVYCMDMGKQIEYNRVKFEKFVGTVSKRREMV